MSWQDWSFFAASLFFCLSLIPTIRDPQARIPRSTSVPTALFILLCAATHVTLGLYLAAGMEALGAALWGYISLTKGK